MSKKRLTLNQIQIHSFVTGVRAGLDPKQPIEPGLIQLDDGTFENCHCPTAACTPSGDIDWTICCL